MRTRRWVALVVAVAAGLTAASAWSASGSGLYGTVRRGPITPVCQVNVPCDAPAAWITLTFTRGAVRKSTRTDGGGNYRIALGPGIYSVRTSSTQFGQPRPAEVHVRVGHFDRIAFTIDTGIR
jgi:hypothetical protein